MSVTLYGSMGVSIDNETLNTLLPPSIITHGSMGVSIDEETLMYVYLKAIGSLGISIDEENLTIPQQAEITPLTQSLIILIMLILTIWLMKEIMDMFSDLME